VRVVETDFHELTAKAYELAYTTHILSHLRILCRSYPDPRHKVTLLRLVFELRVDSLGVSLGIALGLRL